MRFVGWFVLFFAIAQFGCAPRRDQSEPVDENSTLEAAPVTNFSEATELLPDAESQEPDSQETTPPANDSSVDDESSLANPQPSDETTTESDAESKSNDTFVSEEAATENQPRADDANRSLEPVEVELGTPDLTAGIPGEGELTIEQIKSWLDDPENHRVIQPRLPFGLSAAQGSIKGIDKNPMTRAKIELGRQLYFDTRLSIDDTISCASCHHPDEGYTRHTQFGIGVDGQTGNRNSPVSYNRIVSDLQFWDGRAESLEAQAVGPIANPIEMGNTHENAVNTIRKIEGYRIQFEKVFDDGVTIDNIGKAIATFERAIVTGPSPYDYYERVNAIKSQYGGDEFFEEDLKEEDPELYQEFLAAIEKAKPMSESARRGRDLFFSDRVGCTACHAGANFTDEQYHNLGVGMDAEKPDLGRYEVTKQEKDKGAFKTPTVRNVALSAPYMHDGSQQTLKEVVQWYNQGGHPNPYLSDKIKKIGLTEQEIADLVNFMTEGLTSDFPVVERERLPK